ncbi:MAG: hypothetical protein WD069_06800 [Planctomycetales bacterium]
MRGKTFWTTGLVVALGVALGAYALTRSQASTAEADQVQSDCPGRIVCPLSGEEVCKDQCPLLDANRSDCPGKIECPIDGELVCRDECPLGADSGAEARSEADLPPCCRVGQ